MMEKSNLQTTNSRFYLSYFPSLRGALRVGAKVNVVMAPFVENKRRGNLPSPNNWRDVFGSGKTNLPQTQSREIASWIEQPFTKLTFKITHTKTRNDELRWRQTKLQTIRNISNQKGNYALTN
jgi:hypothetical protein